MSVLVYVDHNEGKFSRSALEAVYFASKLGGELTAVALGEIPAENLGALGNYGAKKVLNAKGDIFEGLHSQAYAKAISQAMEDAGANLLVFSHNYTSKAVAPRIAAKIGAGLIVGVVALPTDSDGKLLFKRSVFSGKGFAYCEANTEKQIITLQSNSIPVETGSDTAEVVDLKVEITEQDRAISVKEVKKATDKVSLAEASIVVSAGRGMKGPENWGIIEALADELDAALACSRPVSDTGWRPHSEHVGQTGKTIRPNLYVAIGISGAIQHLAGVNGSKFIVVINKDPEAPFFKAADYGVIGDAFDVVPRLTEAFQKYKASL